MRKKIITICIISILTIINCTKVDLTTDRSAMSYMLAYEFAKSHPFEKNGIKKIKTTVKMFHLKEATIPSNQLIKAYYNHLELLSNQNITIDKDAYIAGIEDLNERKTSRLSADRVKKLQGHYYGKLTSKEKLTPAEFQNKLEKDKNLKKTRNGLFYTIIKKSKGEKPTESARVTAHMIGSLTNGIELVNTYTKGSAMKFYVNKTIKGIKEGLALMPKGSRYKFYIPPKLGYGDKPKKLIPANSYLVYEVELIDIE